jgi:hypothetical protein
MNIRNLAKQYIDVDAILKNDEVVQWYERLRKAGFVFLLFNFAYLFGYMCFRVIADFTISSFLFGYFIQSICNISSFVSDTFRNNEREIRGYIGKQLGNWIGAIKVAIDYAEEYFEGKSTTVDNNSKSSVSEVAPPSPSQESSQESAHVPSRPPITISLWANSYTVKNNDTEPSSSELNSDTSSVKSVSDEASVTQKANIDLNIETKTKDTVIRLDPSALEYLLLRNNAQNALMNKVMKLDQSVIDTSTSSVSEKSVSTNDAKAVESEEDIQSENEAHHTDETYHDSQSGSDGDDENVFELSHSELMPDDISHSEDEDNNRETYRSHKDQ